ncbi:tRNA (N6-threonylcarbamoyladenosine(37)-N6)-methyltransferase TrmO [Vibrio sp. SS-MA-C1-2]|uniref:tRNA (N6-threonylcarbamoyladenosine(37)-N6)-methyltransferase TrmO n=1 Tax=Vibrio sp. SS-MA-C1-2 TaxID=2908646 RepID=UPI001F031CE9|nr:tRNA (N6-threonylcarbamoyladenosine(37)-N6)-methyltransferase TrmO [Vibrio sp. SS-MA-C1-2]UJF18881.1 tRNA (N6-threonylcarbamoyladenosine(37)-N6)-methyltransferase TrmO [Vibrio sp. SS-MA-C1-2]
MMNEYTITPVGHINTPYKEKFAVPRQPNLVPSAHSQLILEGLANTPESVREIEQFSHLWLLFLFDKNLEQGWRPTVRPPRLGGNQRIGVFASRATFRPNSIGMSAVKLERVELKEGQVILHLSGVDLVDNTPIIDIKPYIPYSDIIEEAEGGFASDAPELKTVTFNSASLQQLNSTSHCGYYQQVIMEVLAQDPRPAYKKNKPDTKEYAVHLFDFNVTFRINEQQIEVINIESF